MGAQYWFLRYGLHEAKYSNLGVTVKAFLSAALILFSINTSAFAAEIETLPANILAKHLAITGNECNSDIPGNEEFDLGGKAKLYMIRCYMGAYQGSYKVYLSEYDGSSITQVAVLDYSEMAKGVVSNLDLMEASYSPETKTLSTFSKGRGLGDCGTSTVSRVVISEYGGVAIKTVEIRAKAKCDGDYKDWPVVFKQK